MTLAFICLKKNAFVSWEEGDQMWRMIHPSHSTVDKFFCKVVSQIHSNWSWALKVKVKPLLFNFMELLHSTASIEKFEFLLPFSINVLLWISWTENKKFLDSLQQLFAFLHQAKIQMLTAICSIMKLINLSHL